MTIYKFSSISYPSQPPHGHTLHEGCLGTWPSYQYPARREAVAPCKAHLKLWGKIPQFTKIFIYLSYQPKPCNDNLSTSKLSSHWTRASHRQPCTGEDTTWQVYHAALSTWKPFYKPQMSWYYPHILPSQGSHKQSLKISWEIDNIQNSDSERYFDQFCAKIMSEIPILEDPGPPPPGLRVCWTFLFAFVISAITHLYWNQSKCPTIRWIKILILWLRKWLHWMNKSQKEWPTKNV